MNISTDTFMNINKCIIFILDNLIIHNYYIIRLS